MILALSHVALTLFSPVIFDSPHSRGSYPEEAFGEEVGVWIPRQRTSNYERLARFLSFPELAGHR